MTWPLYQRSEVMVNGSRVALQRKQADLLAVLLLRRGEVVSKTDLIEALWPDPDGSPEGEEVVLFQHVYYLRRRIPGIVRTHIGRGYSIASDLELLVTATA
jgi:DNA-binding winged helix-turn-helix (wHTH) protein